jgi:ABC-type Fe3+/spermidine/putrescine transport system ATPase subunit
MTVAENVSFGLRVKPRDKRPPKAAIDAHVNELLRLVQLERLGNRYPSQLSGGQRQRVALARALAIQPGVLLLLDEPFGALDKKLRVEMQIEVKQLVTMLGMTTIFVTHDQEEAMRMSDRVAVMNSGCIIQCDAPDAIYDRPRDLFVADFIGTSNLLDAVVRGRDGNRVRVDVSGVSLDLTGDADTSAVGESAVVMIRPENLALSDASPSGVGAWPGVVTLALHAGAVMEYEVAVGERRVRVSRPRMQTESARIWAKDDRVAVTVVDSGAVRIFPRGGHS